MKSIQMVPFKMRQQPAIFTLSVEYLPPTQHLGLIMFNKYHQNFKSLLPFTLVILPTAKKTF